MIQKILVQNVQQHTKTQINFTKDKTSVIFAPNGTGKTTFCRALLETNLKKDKVNWRNDYDLENKERHDFFGYAPNLLFKENSKTTYHIKEKNKNKRSMSLIYKENSFEFWGKNNKNKPLVRVSVFNENHFISNFHKNISSGLLISLDEKIEKQNLWKKLIKDFDEMKSNLENLFLKEEKDIILEKENDKKEIKNLTKEITNPKIMKLKPYEIISIYLASYYLYDKKHKEYEHFLQSIFLLINTRKIHDFRLNLISKINNEKEGDELIKKYQNNFKKLGKLALYIETNFIFKNNNYDEMIKKENC